MKCIRSGFVPFLLNMFFLLPLSCVDGWCKRQVQNCPTRKNPERTSIDEAGHSTFMKISSGKAKLFLWTWMKLHLCTCHETVCNLESKEQFGEVCALYHAVHNIKSCLCWWGKKLPLTTMFLVTHCVFLVCTCSWGSWMFPSFTTVTAKLLSWTLVWFRAQMEFSGLWCCVVW